MPTIKPFTTSGFASGALLANSLKVKLAFFRSDVVNFLIKSSIWIVTLSDLSSDILVACSCACCLSSGDGG